MSIVLADVITLEVKGKAVFIDLSLKVKLLKAASEVKEPRIMFITRRF